MLQLIFFSEKSCYSYTWDALVCICFMTFWHIFWWPVTCDLWKKPAVQLPLELLKLILCKIHWLQEYKMSLQAACIVTELETLWNFIHVCFLKSRKSTSEIHLNSLHASNLNSRNESIALQWSTEIQKLKIRRSISYSYTRTYKFRVTSVLILERQLIETTRPHHKGTQKLNASICLY